MSHNHQKKVAVVNDFCGFGRCSLAVSLPIISALKLQCCPLPTSIFSNHTGFSSFHSTDYTEHMDAYIDEWVKLGLHFDGILTGYLASSAQIEIVTRFLKQFGHDKNITVIDPVMGDGGRLYTSYSEQLSKRMTRLVEYADVLTPNLTEACILTGKEYREDISDGALLDIAKELLSYGPRGVVISGLERKGELLNLVVDSSERVDIIGTERVGKCRSGTGDVFSSIITADLVLGRDLSDAVGHAAEFIGRVMKRSVELDLPLTDGVAFEEYLTEI